MMILGVQGYYLGENSKILLKILFLNFKTEYLFFICISAIKGLNSTKGDETIEGKGGASNVYNA